MRYVIAYDISDDGTRERVANTLSRRGVRIQRSVFETDLDALPPLLDQLATMIDLDTDTVHAFAVCRACGRASDELGQTGPGMRSPYWIV